MNNKTLALTFSAGMSVFFHHCKNNTPMQPNKPCIDNQPVEDTTRVYQMPLSRDTVEICPDILLARFYQSVTDTTQIMQLLEKHNLRLQSPLFGFRQQLAAWLCLTDNRRAEYHSTPYGKEGFCNFGADSLAEYAFGVFDDGSTTPSGDIDFRFVDGTSQARIDSLFEANGLRFLFTRPDIPTGKWYRTLVTPRSEKNAMDLAYELQSAPFVQFVDFGFFTGGSRRCRQ